MARKVFAGTRRGLVVLDRHNGSFREAHRAFGDAPITAVAANGADHLVFAGTPQGLFRSADEGRNWTGLEPFSGKEIRYVHINRDTRHVYVGIHPDIDLSISADRGERWERVNFPSKVPTGIREKWVFHPFPKYGPHVKSIATGRGRIYVNIEEGWCYRSDDGGSTWEPLLYNGLNIDAHVLAVHPDNRDIVYSTDAFGACKSSNGGETWRRLNPAEYGPRRYGGGVVVHPKKPSVVLFSLGLARVFTLGVKGAQSTIFRTVDGGETWHRVTAGLPEPVNGRIETLVFDDGEEAAVYAMTDLGEVFEGREDGGTWRLIASGLGGSSAHYTLGVM